MSLFIKLLRSAKYIMWRDLVAPFIFIVTSPAGMSYKLYLKMVKKELWLIAEGKNDARDNGYVLFEYIRTQHPSVNVYYAINKESSSYKKVSPYGNIIQYQSLKHWVYYIAATKNISIHKAANPNPPLFYVLHRTRLLSGNRIFLQHGVIMNDLKYLYYGETFFKLFICGALPEYKFIQEKFGYPKSAVRYTGLARFDKLHGVKVDKKKIVIMPTWRSWLGRDVNILESSQRFDQSEYYQQYQELINNEGLIRLVESRGVDVFFYLHANMEKYKNHFASKSRNIHLIDSDTHDIQNLISTSGLLVTDYSSINMDFAYMKKPVIYFQFDVDRFRDEHLPSGYFSYTDDGFGPVVKTVKDVVHSINGYLEHDLSMEEEYKNRVDQFFVLNDTKNCERIFQCIKDMEHNLAVRSSDA